jgi:hypothetical protein
MKLTFKTKGGRLIDIVSNSKESTSPMFILFKDVANIIAYAQNLNIKLFTNYNVEQLLQKEYMHSNLGITK